MTASALAAETSAKPGISFFERVGVFIEVPLMLAVVAIATVHNLGMKQGKSLLNN